MTHATDQPLEFSRALALDRLNAGPVERSFSARAAECAALAERFGIEAVRHLRGDLRVTRPAGGPTIRITGTVEAEVVQTCVVTLDPVVQQVREAFVQRFTLEAAPEPAEIWSDPNAEEPPEPVVGEHLDLGEVLAEQLALALDPYPRAPGATFEGARFGDDDAEDAEDEAPASPFAVLEQLKSSR